MEKQCRQARNEEEAAEFCAEPFVRGGRPIVHIAVNRQYAGHIVISDTLKPGNIATAVRIARKTLAIVKQNISFALAVKGITLLLAALGIANMWWAVFADVGVTVLAVFNAMRAGSIRVR